MEKKIILVVQEKELVFNMTGEIHNKFINEMHSPKSKVNSYHNLCMRAVDDASKADLEEVLKLPSASLEIASTLIDEFTPELNIRVGK